jgi:hypothetical protein
MGKTARAAQQARARARQRMVELERERLERQRRIEDATTAVFLAHEQRAIALQGVRDAEEAIRVALRSIEAEGTDIKQVADLCDMTPSEVRRLTRARIRRPPDGAK